MKSARLADRMPEMLLIASTAVTLLLLSSTTTGVRGEPVVPSSEATEIGKIVCTPEDFHDDKWFKCIECCQSINAYFLVRFVFFSLSFFFPH